MPFTIIRQDITKMKVDAIVNAANTDLLMGGGVCGAIFNAAGAAELQAACDQVAPIQTGKAVITPGFALPAKHIIHAAGPVYSQTNPKDSERLLRSAYLNSLQLAVEHKLESIAFPLISSGIYGYPKDQALNVATTTIQDFLEDHDLDVYLVVFDRDSFQVSKRLLGQVASYIDEHYAHKHMIRRRDYLQVEREALDKAEIAEYNAPMMQMEQELQKPPTAGITTLVNNLDESFSTTLLRLIDARGMKDVEVYKRANIDKKLFSKIRSDKDYRPTKRTALALAIGLKLSLKETSDLLQRAGFALSHSQKFDVIVEYFIINRKYNIFEINEVLFKYDQPLLGGNYA